MRDAREIEAPLLARVTQGQLPHGFHKGFAIAAPFFTHRLICARNKAFAFIAIVIEAIAVGQCVQLTEEKSLTTGG